jgi:molybdopterin converting factor small subunit
MRIHVRLFANLRDRFPGGDRGKGDVDLDDGASLADLINRLEIPDPQVQMVLVDGQQVPRTTSGREERVLQDGETVSIFPPVSGG